MQATAGAGPLTQTEIELATAAAQRVVEVHRKLSDWLRPGLTLPLIDAFVARTLDSLKCKSCFIGYRPSGMRIPFPSHACLSVNDCVVHGTAASYTKPLGAGDVLKIDIGVRYQGWIGDAAWTYLFPPVDPLILKLTRAGKDSLAAGVAAISPRNTWSAFAHAVEDVVERQNGFYLTENLGGHGINLLVRGERSLHCKPFVSNSVQPRSQWPEGAQNPTPGSIVAVEPMIAVGTRQTRTDRGNPWPVYSADGSMTVHYEHDILVTDDGQRILTDGLQDVCDIVKS